MRPDAALLQINSRRYPIKRIALINSVIARNDAVSASVRDTYKMLVSAPALRVAVFRIVGNGQDEQSLELAIGPTVSNRAGQRVPVRFPPLHSRIPVRS